MKKFKVFIISLVSAFICFSTIPMYSAVFSAESVSASDSEESGESSPDKKIQIITVIAVFTVTCAVSGFFTYKAVTGKRNQKHEK